MAGDKEAGDDRIVMKSESCAQIQGIIGKLQCANKMRETGLPPEDLSRETTCPKAGAIARTMCTRTGNGEESSVVAKQDRGIERHQAGEPGEFSPSGFFGLDGPVGFVVSFGYGIHHDS